MLTQALRYNAGRIRVKDCPFGAPDGTANQFQLVDRHGHAVTRDVRIQSIHQTDWQGRVELSSEPRANALSYSDDFTSWVNPASGFGIAPSAKTVNDIELTELLESANSSQHQLNQASAPIAAGTHTCACVFQAGTYDHARILFYNSTNKEGWADFDLSNGTVSLGGQFAPSTASAAAIGDGLWLCSATRTSTDWDYIRIGNGHTNTAPYQGDGTSTIFLARAWEVIGADAGLYIPTTGAPVTVTDYTHDGQGGITTGQVPDATAALDWTGSARRAA